MLGLMARGFNVLFSAKTPTLRVVEDDPDDDKFIECAVELKADYVISGDRHLLAVGDYMGIKIQSPASCLEGWQDSTLPPP